MLPVWHQAWAETTGRAVVLADDHDQAVVQGVKADAGGNGGDCGLRIADWLD